MERRMVKILLGDVGNRKEVEAEFVRETEKNIWVKVENKGADYSWFNVIKRKKSRDLPK